MADKEETVAGHQPAVDDDDDLVAGRQKAVKIAGRRYSQNKSTRPKSPMADLKDVTGLTQPPNINSDTVSGAKIEESTAFPPKASQVAHAPKPPKSVPNHQPGLNTHINQPRR